MGVVEEIICIVYVSVTNVTNLVLTLRKCDLFVLSWAMVRRVRRGSISRWAVVLLIMSDSDSFVCKKKNIYNVIIISGQL